LPASGELRYKPKERFDPALTAGGCTPGERKKAAGCRREARQRRVTRELSKSLDRRAPLKRLPPKAQLSKKAHTNQGSLEWDAFI